MIDVTSVGLPSMNILTWVLALAPIVLVLVLMLAFKVSGARAGVIAWVLTAVIAYFIFHAGPDVIGAGTVKGLWSTINVLYIIWSSMFLYNVVNETGAFKVIAAKFTEMTNGNKLLQLLILGWAFPTFIQGVCGFGVPVAVATPLLIGLGFDPLMSVITALLGHSWGIAYGSLGSMYGVLTGLSNYPKESAENLMKVGIWGAIFCTIGCLLVGFCILHNYGSRTTKNVGKTMAEGAVAVIFETVVMGATLIGMVAISAPTLGCFAAGAVGLILGTLVLPKLPMYKPVEGAEAGEKTSWGDFLKNFSGYLILVVVVCAIMLINPIKNALNGIVTLGLHFNANQLGGGLTYGNAEVAKYSGLKFFTMPGSLILYSTALAILCYKSLGMLPQGAIGQAWQKTIKQSIGSTTTVIPLTMMAMLMVEAGMTKYIAYGIAMVVGNLYPIFSPFIALLGGYVTSSGTSSNNLFTNLQEDVATVLGISVPIILSCQTAEAALSNSFSPGNAALGTGVSGQSGREGEILAATGVYNAIQSLVLGVVAYVLIKMGLGM